MSNQPQIDKSARAARLREAADRIERGEEVGVVVDDPHDTGLSGDLRPWWWFARYTSIDRDKLFHATRAKHKRVRSEKIDGVRMYSASDAKRIYPDEFNSENA